MSPITLAYVGDAIFTLYVRTRLVESYDYKTDRLGKMCSFYVCAATQSKIFEEALDFLDEEEREIGRRCRNTHTPAKAKNASMSDYKRATALEGILGYLYLSGRYDRLKELSELFFLKADEAKENSETVTGGEDVQGR